MQTLENYSAKNQNLFTHEFVKVGQKIITVYKNQGYTAKSKVYGPVFDLSGKDIDVRLKTKKQVVLFLSKLN